MNSVILLNYVIAKTGQINPDYPDDPYGPNTSLLHSAAHFGQFEKSITKNTGLQLERIYNFVTAMGFSAMFTFQLDNTKM